MFARNNEKEGPNERRVESRISVINDVFLLEVMYVGKGDLD